MKNRNQIHNWIPREMKVAVRDCKCPTCGEELDTKRINLIGIKQHTEGQIVLHLECTCKCGKKLEISLKRKRSIEQLCYMIIEEIEKDRRLDAVKRRFKREFTEMKDSEVKEFLDQFRDVRYHEDFMDMIGSGEYAEKQEESKQDGSQS